MSLGNIPIQSSCWSSKALLYICYYVSAFTNRLSCRDTGTNILRKSNHLQSDMLADCSSVQLHCFHFHSERKQKIFEQKSRTNFFVCVWVLDVGEKISFSYLKRVCISISVHAPILFNLLISYMGTLFVTSVLHWVTSISFFKQSKWPKIVISWRTKGTTSSNFCPVSWKLSWMKRFSLIPTYSE